MPQYDKITCRCGGNAYLATYRDEPTVYECKRCGRLIEG